MRFTYSGDQPESGKSVHERRPDLSEDFDAREYGALEVSPRSGHIRQQRAYAAGALASRSLFARRGRRVLACALASMFTALLSIYMQRLIANYTLRSVSSAAAERRRIAFVDPADELTGDETPNRINREVQGLDPIRREMTDAEIASELNDPLALLVLRRNVFPPTLDDLLNALDSQNVTPAGVPTQSVFLVGEGSQIQFNAATANVGRQLRFIIGRQRGSNVDLLISVGAGGPPDGFLQGSN